MHLLSQAGEVGRSVLHICRRLTTSCRCRRSRRRYRRRHLPLLAAQAQGLIPCFILSHDP